MRKLRVVVLMFVAVLLIIGVFVAWRWSQFREHQTLRAADDQRAPIVARPLPGIVSVPAQACIAGRVVDGDQPVSGAQVSLSTSPPTVSADCPCSSIKKDTCTCFEGLDQLRDNARIGMLEAVQSVISADDGTFSLCGLTDSKPRLVWAEHSDGRVAMRTDGNGEVSAGASVILRVQHPREIEGVVVNDAGPVRGAIITALPLPQITSVTFKADTNGRFRQSLIAGRHLFIVSAPGYEPNQYRRSVPSDGPLVFKLAPVVELTVRVEHEGRPVEGATVWRIREAPVQTDARGIAKLKARKNMEVDVRARKGLLVASANVNPLSREPALVVLALEQGAQLRGTIVDEAKTPLANTSIEVEGLDEPLMTDARGQFVTPPLPKRQLGLYASHDDCLKNRRFVRPGIESDLTLELQCAASARGRVVDAAGTPIEGAELSLSIASEDERVTTAADGRFVFFGKGPGLVSVKHPRYQKTQQPLSLPSSEEVTIVLDAAASVSGRVVDADGKPVVGAKVETVPAFDVAAAQDDGLKAFTDGDGHFELHGLRAGRFALMTTARGHGQRASDTFALQPGEQRDGFEIRLDGKVELSGVVLDEKGQPVPGASVVWEQPDDTGAISRVVLQYAAGDMTALTSMSSARNVTDAEGRFEFRDLTAEASTVKVYAVGFVSTEGTPAKRGQRLEIRLKRQGIARGRVVDEAGRPMRSFEVDDVTFSDGSGRFEVGAASSAIRVSAAGYQRHIVELKEDNSDIDVGDVTLQRATSLRVTVKSESDTPFIAVVSAGINTCRTSEVPWCELVDLPDGDLRVEITADMHLAEERKVMAVDRAKGLELTLRSAKGRLEGIAFLKPGVPAAGVELKVSGAGNTTTVTAANGAFTVAGIDEGAACISLTLSDAMMGEWSAPVDASSTPTPLRIGPVVNGANIEVTGALRTMTAIQGDHPEDTLLGGTASYICGRMKRTTVLSGNLGVTRIEGLPPGTWTVWFGDITEGPDKLRREVLELQAGQTVKR